jgi:hypothetical protein
MQEDRHNDTESHSAGLPSTRWSDTCDQPCDMIVSVQPDGDSWKVVVNQEGPNDDERREMVEQIAQRLKAQFDLKR